MFQKNVRQTVNFTLFADIFFISSIICSFLFKEAYFQVGLVISLIILLFSVVRMREYFYYLSSLVYIAIIFVICGIQYYFYANPDNMDPLLSNLIFAGTVSIVLALLGRQVIRGFQINSKERRNFEVIGKLIGGSEISFIFVLISVYIVSYTAHISEIKTLIAFFSEKTLNGYFPLIISAAFTGVTVLWLQVKIIKTLAKVKKNIAKQLS